jgi:Mg2+/Co2+ transporter CorB
MEDSEILAVVFLCVFLLTSALFSATKCAFSLIYAKRDPKDRDDREEKIAAIVKWRGFNECVSIGRIFGNVGAAVLGFFLLENSSCPFVHTYPYIAVVVYLIVACALIYVVSVFVPYLVANLKPDTLSVILVPLFRVARLPFIPAAKICHVVFVKLLVLFGYDSKLSFLSEEMRDAVQADLSDTKNGKKTASKKKSSR